MTAGQIDNRQPSKTKSQRPVKVVPFVIGTPMDYACCVIASMSRRWTGSETFVVILSANATHMRLFSLQTRNYGPA